MREFQSLVLDITHLECFLTPIPVMIAENVSVGILSLPSAVATLGMAPYVSSFGSFKA